MFEMSLGTSKAYGKPPPESKQRVLEAGGLDGIATHDSDGLRTLLIADGARCYPGLAKKKTLLLQQCNHSKGIFCIKKKLKQRGWVKVHTGNIDCFWKGAKKSIPGSLSSKVKGRRHVQLWKCLRRFQWRWEHTGKDMCKHTSKTLRTLLEKRRPRTWDLFEPKTLEGLLLKKQTIIFFSDSLKHQNCIAIVVKRNFLLKSWAGNESAGMFLKTPPVGPICIFLYQVTHGRH